MSYQKQLEKWGRRKAKFQGLVAQGWTCRRIAEANGLSVQRVQQIVGKRQKEVKPND